MNKKEYQEYLQSSHWKKISKERRNLDGNKCRTCGYVDNLEVHHVCYDRIGHEFIDDLITLCHDCHQAVTVSIKQKGKRQRGIYKNHRIPDASWRQAYTEPVIQRTESLLKTISNPPPLILFGKKKRELQEQQK